MSVPAPGADVGSSSAGWPRSSRPRANLVRYLASSPLVEVKKENSSFGNGEAQYA